MANQFDFLARAKPASLYKLLEKLPPAEAAIVLTGLPHALAIQSLAYFPENRQGEFLPLMRRARSMPQTDRDAVANKIRGILDTAKNAKTAQDLAAQPIAPAAPASSASGSVPAAPQLQPLTLKHMHNPYESAPQPKAPPVASGKAKDRTPAQSPFAGLGSKLMDALGKAASGGKSGTSKSGQSNPGAPAKSGGKPVPWMPRAATSSPINGPAVPGSGPPVSGDPFKSPLAQAGLLDLIGRAQERLMPKNTARPAVRPSARASAGSAAPERHSQSSRPLHPPAKPGRPEPREGVVSLTEIEFSKTPRVIGPRPKSPPPGSPAPALFVPDESNAPTPGARHVDGKAILAAILREAGSDVRGSVQQDNPALMRELRGRMFHFDDLLCTDDNALARVFTAAPADSAALALQFAPPELRRRVMNVVSPGRARALESPPGKTGFDAVEAAQKKVLDVALQLQAAGRILIDPRDPDLAAGR